MKNMLANFLPMKFIERRFMDRISGEMVNLYMQTNGELVLSTSRFSTFRVKANSQKIGK